MKKLINSLIMITMLTSLIYANPSSNSNAGGNGNSGNSNAGGNGNGNANGHNNPNNPHYTGDAPINSGIVILLVVGLSFATYSILKNKQNQQAT